MAELFRIKGVDHLVLRVKQLQPMLEFYQQLGCQLERQEVKQGLYQLRAGAQLIDLIPVDQPLGAAGGAAPGSQGHNLDHFCLQVQPFQPEQIRAWCQARQIPCSDVAERYGSLGFGPSLYIKDPEGNSIELKAG
jgi:glyoxylase I family protein